MTRGPHGTDTLPVRPPAPPAPPTSASHDAPDASAYRAAMGRYPTGVTLLTRGSGDDTLAMTLNSLTSVSLDPLLLLISVRADGRLRPAIAAGGSFAVNVLTGEQRDLAVEFCRRDRPEGRAAMRRMGAVQGVTGNAVIPSAEAGFECVLHAQYEAGDHVLFVGRVVALSCGPRDSVPLLFHQGGFTSLPAIRSEAA